MSKHQPGCDMTRAETAFGWIYLFVMQLLPVPIAILLKLAGIHLDSTWMNVLFFTFNFLVILLVFRRYLAGSFRTFGRHFLRTLALSTIGFAVYMSVNFVVSMAITINWPDFANANDSNIQAMSQDHYWPLFIATVVLVPITEETLFRGVVFGSLRKASPVIAYIFSCLIFSAIHVIPYVGKEGFTLTFALVSLLQYLPASLCLAWLYDKCNTIVAPALVHSAVNLVGMLMMR